MLTLKLTDKVIEKVLARHIERPWWAFWRRKIRVKQLEYHFRFEFTSDRGAIFVWFQTDVITNIVFINRGIQYSLSPPFKTDLEEELAEVLFSISDPMIIAIKYGDNL